jgi:hypothetical protein
VKKSPTPNDLVTEEMVQVQIMQGLRISGYIVQQTTHRYRKTTCPKCHHPFHPKFQSTRNGETVTVGYGSSKGVADLLVTHPKWQAPLWIAIEVKRPGKIKYSSQEQADLAASGAILVAQSFDEALAKLQPYHDILTQTP